MRVALAICNPSPGAAFEAGAFLQHVSTLLNGSGAQRKVELDCLQHATAASLHQLLLEREPEVLYIVARAKMRAAAAYAVVTLCSASGQGRDVTARAFAQALRQHSCLRLVILGPCDAASADFALIAGELLAEGIPTVITPFIPQALQSTFIARLLTGAVLGVGAGDLAAELASAVLSSGLDAAGFRAFAPTSRAAAPAAPTADATAAVRIQPAAAAPQASLAAAAQVQAELQRKRALGEFDVFLCHNSVDKPAVQALGTQLKSLGILPWLDIWELPPGRPWQPLLEEQLSRIRSAAVFVGSAGIGPWQEQEMYGFLRMFVERQAPVIPVMLATAPAAPKLPVFLQAMTWVDFRAPQSRPLERLLWGVTGRRPSD